MRYLVEQSSRLSRVLINALLSVTVVGFCVALSPSAQAQCDSETFEAAIEVAGAGERVAYDLIDEISTLPIPVPKPGRVRFIAGRFADVSKGVVRVRSHVFKGNVAAAHAEVDVLMHYSSQIGRRISEISTLPIPLPSPKLLELEAINIDLMSEISTLPIPIPDDEIPD